MSHQMEINYLRKEDLEFEARVREVDSSGKSVVVLRVLLRPLITAECTGESTEPVPRPTFEFNYEVEVPVIEANYANLLKEVNRFQDPAAKNGRSRKLYSRMLHLLNRVNVTRTITGPVGAGREGVGVIPIVGWGG